MEIDNIFSPKLKEMKMKIEIKQCFFNWNNILMFLDDRCGHK